MRDARLIRACVVSATFQLRFRRSFVGGVHRRRRQIEYRRHCVIGWHVVEHRISQLAHPSRALMDNVRVRDLTRQQMQERLLSSCHRCGTRQGVGLSSVLAWAVLALFKSRPGKRSPETRCCASGQFSTVRSRVASNGAPARALHLPWCTAPISRRIHASRRPDRLSRASQGRCGHVAA